MVCKSRITAGPIELIAKGVDVNRIGYAQVYELQEDDGKNLKEEERTTRQFNLEIESARDIDEEEPRIIADGVRHFPRMEAFADFLEGNGLFMAYANLRFGCPNKIDHHGKLAWYLGFGDVYGEKDAETEEEKSG